MKLRYSAYLTVLVVLLLVAFDEAGCGVDLSRWSRFRNLEISKNENSGIAVVYLESDILRSCRADLGDIRITDSEGAVVPFVLADPRRAPEPSPLPAKILKINQTPGKWTEIVVDKTAKMLSTGIEIHTSSKDFVRKVEIRGSDTLREAYVVNMDGLIADIKSPLAINSADVQHPKNCFQYLNIRIINGEQPPLKIDKIGVFTPEEKPAFKTVEGRVIENRTDAAGSTTLIVDFGAKRYPLANMTLSIPQKQFVKKALISGCYNQSEEWRNFREAVLFRLLRDGAVKQNLDISLGGETYRFIMIELSGGSAGPVNIERPETYAVVPSLFFEAKPESSYKLYYDNPRASRPAEWSPPAPLQKLPAKAGIAILGEEQKYSPPVRVAAGRTQPAPPKVKPTSLPTYFGIGMLLAGLILLFSLILRQGSKRRRDRNRFTMLR